MQHAAQERVIQKGDTFCRPSECGLEADAHGGPEGDRSSAGGVHTSAVAYKGTHHAAQERVIQRGTHFAAQANAGNKGDAQGSPGECSSAGDACLACGSTSAAS